MKIKNVLIGFLICLMLLFTIQGATAYNLTNRSFINNSNIPDDGTYICVNGSAGFCGKNYWTNSQFLSYVYSNLTCAEGFAIANDTSEMPWQLEGSSENYNGTLVYPNGMILDMHMDISDGEIITDSTPYNNSADNCSNTGGCPSFENGFGYGYGIRFTGSQGLIIPNTKLSGVFANNYTIETILCPSSGVGPYYLIAMLNQNINVWYNGTAITVYIESSGDHFSSYTQDLSNSCFHLAITKSSDTGLLIYINGSVQVNESTWTWDASATNNFNNIGCYAPYGSCWLYALPDGTKMDEFRIYNQTILTGTQINYDYNNWKNTKGYGNLETELDLCLPSWSCSLYEGCNISGINSCIAINDSNLCGINFTGNLSDYEQSCWYLPIVNESSEGNLTEWRMRQRWLNHTSWDGISYSTIPGLNQVNITIGPYTRSSPAIAEGMLYIGSGNGTLYQLNASNISQIIATYNAGGQIDSSPIVVDGMVYVGIYIDANPNGGRVLQLNATNISQVIHSLTVYGGISYSIPVIANGMLYIGSDGNFGTGILYQLNATDITQIIANYTMGEMYGTPAVADGMLYIGSLDGKIYQLNASNVGQSIANYTTTDYVKASPVVYNGSVYIGGYDGIFYQLNATNISKLIASNNFGSEIFSSAAISNGYVYVGEKLVTNRVYQLDANNISIEIANYNASIYIHSSPAIADGMLYFADDNGVIYQLNASNISQLIATYDVGTGYIYAQISSPAVANGYVYIGMLDGKVYQLNANNISLPNNITSNCTPNWTCDIYSACLPNNTMPCQTIADLNFCGTNFTGNMSDYDMNCTYILPSVLNTTSQDFVEATADNMTKIIVGLGRIAVLLGVVLAGIGISYVIRKLLMKR